MYRGTTPTLTFTLPFECSTITLLNIAFSQQGKLVLEKELSDCAVEGNKLTVTLSEEDTLKFECLKMVDIQLRCGCGESRLASQIISVCAERILKDGCLA